MHRIKGATVYRIMLLLSFCLVLDNLRSQDYYITKDGDTVNCEIKKELPYYIKVKVKKRATLLASEIKEYRSTFGDILTSKKVGNGKEDRYVLLPQGGRDYKFDYSDAHVYITSNGTTTLYEVITYSAATQYGRDVDAELFIEDQSGFSSLPVAGMFAGKKKRGEVINTLKQYFGSNQSIAEKLKDEENIDLGYKAVKNLVEEYFNKKLTK